jgi:hypothetical protein
MVCVQLTLSFRTRTGRAPSEEQLLEAAPILLETLALHPNATVILLTSSVEMPGYSQARSDGYLEPVFAASELCGLLTRA